MRRKKRDDGILNFSKTREIDYDEYIEFILANMKSDEIEEVFKFKNYLLNVRHMSDSDVNRMLFKRYASPDNVPPDVWFSIEDKIDQKYDLDDDDFNPEYDSYGYSDDEVAIDESYSIDNTSIGNPSKILKIGGTFELWPDARYRAACPVSAYEIELESVQNSITLQGCNQIQEAMNKTRYIYHDRLGVNEIKQSLPKNTSGIVMDPPLGKGWLTNQEFLDICEYFHKFENIFIFIWAESSQLSIINNAACFAGLKFCDTIAVELLNEDFNPYHITSSRNFIKTTKIVMIFQTNKMKTDSFVHQKSKDVNYGVCRPYGKSRGRLGTPQIPHEVIEKMLPKEKQKRTFVEIWPTRMSPREDWVFIDEKC